MMLSIKAICKNENNEEVVIIGFELEGYCLCMTKSGTIFHAKHEDLTIVDKEYMQSCTKESIDFDECEGCSQMQEAVANGDIYICTDGSEEIDGEIRIDLYEE